MIDIKQEEIRIKDNLIIGDITETKMAKGINQNTQNRVQGIMKDTKQEGNMAKEITVRNLTEARQDQRTKRDTQEKITVQENSTIKIITEIEMTKGIKQNLRIIMQNAEEDTKQEGIRIKKIMVKSVIENKMMKGIKQNQTYGGIEKNIREKEKEIIKKMGEDGNK